MTKISPKNVFLHLLTMIALYVSAGSFMALIFQYINLGFPDLTALEGYGYYSQQAAYEIIRWAIASLVIIFPLYIFISRMLNKSYQTDLILRESRLRKWLVYFTLFVAAAIIVGDLVTLLFNLLGGELTIRFFLKTLTVFFVSGSVFGYYLWDLKKDKIE